MSEGPPRIPGETDNKYALFLRWLDEVPPTATGQQAAQTLGIKPGNYRVIKNRNRWDERRASHLGTTPTPTPKREPGPAEGVNGDVVTVEVINSSDEWRERYHLGMTQLAALAPEAAQFCKTVLTDAINGEEVSAEAIKLFTVLVRKFLPDQLIHHHPSGEAEIGGRAEALGLTSPTEADDNLAALAERINNLAALNARSRHGGVP